MAKKWETIHAGIVKRIRSLSPGDRLPTVLDLRKEFDASQHSVCRALDSLERDGLIVKKPRGGIRVAVPSAAKPAPERLAYAAWHEDSSENGKGRSHPYFHPLMHAISRAFDRSSYEGRMYLFQAKGIAGSRNALERDIMDGRIRGLIISSFHLGPRDAEFLNRHGVRVVLIGQDLTGSGFPSVENNAVKMGLLVSDAVLRIGRNPVAFITGPARDAAVQSFLMAQAAAGRALAEECAIQCRRDFTDAEQAIADGREAAGRLLALPDRPQVVWITDDIAAMGMLQALHEADVHVPRDLAVVVSTSTACVFSHPVIRIAVNPETVGTVAAEMLVALVRGEPVARTTHYVDPELLDDPERSGASSRAAVS